MDNAQQDGASSAADDMAKRLRAIQKKLRQVGVCVTSHKAWTNYENTGS